MSAFAAVIVGNAPILMILVPLVGAALALIAKVIGSARVLPGAAIAVQVLTGPVLYLSRSAVASGIPYGLGGFSAEPGIMLMMDGMGWISSALIAGMTVVVAVASLSHRHFDAAYFLFLLLTAAGMQAVVMTTDLFTMFVAFEIVAVGVYVLIAWERSPQGTLASLKYLFLSSVGILFFLLGVFLVYREWGTLSLIRVAEISADDPSGTTLIVAALTVGIGVRTAFVPFHTWLPEAHAWAPHPISALLSGVLIKISFLALTRIVIAFGAAYLMPLLSWIGGITALSAVVWALAQHDAKRLLAYHSISQMGFILAAWATGTELGYLAAQAHMITHGVFKALLFVTVGIAIHRTGTRNVYRMRGAGRGAPLLAAGMIVGAAAITGVPPFSGFVSKGLITSALSGSPILVLLRIAAVGTVASFAKLLLVLTPASIPAGPGDPEDTRAPSTPGVSAVASAGVPRRPGVSPGEGTAVATLSLLTIGFGVFGPRLATAMAGITVSDGWRSAIAVTADSTFAATKLLESAALVAIGTIVAVVVLRPGVRRITHRVASIHPRLSTVLAFFVLGVILFWIAPELFASGRG